MSVSTVFEQLLQKSATGIEFQSDKQVVKPIRKEQKLVVSYLAKPGYLKFIRYHKDIACNHLTVSTAKITFQLNNHSFPTVNELWQSLEAEAIRLLSYSKNRNYHLTEQGLYEKVG